MSPCSAGGLQEKRSHLEWMCGCLIQVASHIFTTFAGGGLLVVPKGEPSGIVVYILVDDIEATLSRVAELGGRVVSSRARLSGGYCAYFKDPGGNLLGLYEEESPVQ